MQMTTLWFLSIMISFVKPVLEAESLNHISWFGDNFMKANIDKCEAICVGKKGQ